MLLLGYTWRYLSRNIARTTLIVSGLSSAVAAIVFAYGIAGWVEVLSAKSLESIVAGSTLWVVPSRAISIDHDTGLIVTDDFLSEALIQRLSSIDSGTRLRRVVVLRGSLSADRIVIYFADWEKRIVVSSDLWKAHGSRPGPAVIAGRHVFIAAEDRTLPQKAVRMPLVAARTTFKVTAPASWLVANPADPIAWSVRASAIRGVVVTDNPAIRPSKDSIAIVYLTRSHLSRFDPFTFVTKFSALTLNSRMSTLFGSVARVVLILGFALAISSAMLEISERREEVAILSVTGLTSNLVTLFGVEAAIIQTLSFAIGSIVGIVLLRFAVTTSYQPQILVQALAFALTYVPALVVSTTLLPAQAIASGKPLDALRRGD